MHDTSRHFYKSCHFIIITSLLVVTCKRGHHYKHCTEENTEAQNSQKSAQVFKYLFTSEGREPVFVSIVPTQLSRFNNGQFGGTSYFPVPHVANEETQARTASILIG